MDTAGSDRKPEKQTTGLSSYFRFNVVLTAFRLLEVGLALFFLLRVPFALKLSCEYSCLLLGFMARPLFVFILCNVIIAALLTKPGRFCARRPPADDDGGGAAEELYEEIVKISESRARPVLPLFREAEEVVYEDKEIISEVSTGARAGGGGVGAVDFEEEVAEEEDEECRGGRRPPQAEKRPRTARSGGDSWESSRADYNSGGCGGDDDEELSNEEFQRAIDAFIAKQLRFRQEESLAIVLQSH
ncbi:hypothetical protein ACJRO7_035904 [Eucalyptus globulus]|uniref:DUF4408 domain-containing protein n=1 Tax=Eucalyptus globulus TaxID=34317 RepID=A0ABD3JDA6_EUCGL